MAENLQHEDFGEKIGGAKKDLWKDRGLYVDDLGSMAVKGLVCELPPVDSGYRGEIHAILSNVSSRTQHIPKGSRIGQLVITPVVIADFVTELGEQRGTGAFGSTGK